VAPALALLGAFHVVPVAYALWLSLQEWRIGAGPPAFVGLGNFRALAADPGVWGTLTASGTFLVLDVLVILGGGLLAALAVNARPRGAGVLCALALAPWATTAVVAGVIWRWILEPDVGLLTLATGGAGRAALMTPGGAMASVVVADAWRTLGFAVVFLLAGLQTIDRDVYAAARIDGARGWTALRHVTLPLLRPILTIVTILLTLHALNSMEVIWILTGGGPVRSTETASLRVYREVFTYFDLGAGAAWAGALLLANGVLAAGYLRSARTPRGAA
jgi:multiple sugar transport system permease protein